MTKTVKTSKKGYSDISGIIKSLTGLTKVEDDEVLLYRGESNYDWELVPSIKRNGYEQKENLFIKEIISSYPNEFKDDKTTLEYLIRAQHYELPTRLLDLTLNPLIALYFALDRVEQKDESGKTLVNEDGTPKLADGKVLVFKIKKNLIKYYDSDTASCIANLSFLTYSEKNEIIQKYEEYKKAIKENAGNKEKAQKDFLTNKSLVRLLHFIKLEKVHFDDNINPEHLFSNIVVKGKMNNHRIIAQQGLFLLCGLSNIDKNSKELELVAELKITASAKDKLKSDLNNTMSINNSSIYPEIIQHSRYIKETF